MVRVLTFGTFDGIHAGHEALFAQARAYGDWLVVGVARDKHVRELKHKDPRFDEQARLAAVQKRIEVDEALLCDDQLGSFGMIERVKPDVFVIGHDQDDLGRQIVQWLSGRGLSIDIQRARKVPEVKDLDIVVGICERDGKFLLLQRRDQNPLWDKKWEFPGGKLKRGEDPQSAIDREIMEETGLPSLDTRFLRNHVHDWPLPDHVLRVHIACFHCRIGEGEARLEEGKAYQHRWVSRQELLVMDTLAANKDMFNAFFHEALSDMG